MLKKDVRRLAVGTLAVVPLLAGVACAEMADDTLRVLNPAIGSNLPTPAVAWAQLDPLTMELTLRDDVTLHDGTARMAEGVVCTYNTIATEASQTLSGGRIGFLILDEGAPVNPEGPFTNLQVRRVMAHAIDGAGIDSALIGRAAARIEGACHPSELGCNHKVAVYRNDPEKPRALLAEAGITGNTPQVRLDSQNVAQANRQIPACFGTWGDDRAPLIRQHFDHGTTGKVPGDGDLFAMVVEAYAGLDAARQAELFAKIHAGITDQAYRILLWSYSVNDLTDPGLVFPLDDDGFPRLSKVSRAQKTRTTPALPTGHLASAA